MDCHFLKIRKFHKKNNFANSVKSHICDVENSRIDYISKKSVLAIWREFCCHETSHICHVFVIL